MEEGVGSVSSRQMPALLRFDGAVDRDPDIERWLDARPQELGSIARTWFAELRRSGAHLQELMHDGCPTVCLDGAGIAYVGVFTRHVNLGFFQGASLPDPAGLLEGTGKYMRHVKLRPGEPCNSEALRALIEAAYSDMLSRLAQLER